MLKNLILIFILSLFAPLSLFSAPEEITIPQVSLKCLVDVAMHLDNTFCRSIPEVTRSTIIRGVGEISNYKPIYEAHIVGDDMKITNIPNINLEEASPGVAFVSPIVRDKKEGSSYYDRPFSVSPFKTINNIVTTVNHELPPYGLEKKINISFRPKNSQREKQNASDMFIDYIVRATHKLKAYGEKSL